MGIRRKFQQVNYGRWYRDESKIYSNFVVMASTKLQHSMTRLSQTVSLHGTHKYSTIKGEKVQKMPDLTFILRCEISFVGDKIPPPEFKNHINVVRNFDFHSLRWSFPENLQSHVRTHIWTFWKTTIIQAIIRIKQQATSSFVPQFSAIKMSPSLHRLMH